MRLLPFLVLALIGPTAGAQNVSLSGLAYLDYNYVLSGPDGQTGDNGFGYRRIYLTTDFDIARSFDGRFRLEAQDARTSGDGKPVVFVKDAWLRWRGALGEGHDVVLGVAPPPAMAEAERFWGFRSLARSLLDRADVADTRDMGLKVTGPIGERGGIRYGMMVANNSSVGAETDRAKRVYGQVAMHRDASTVSVAADYAAATGTIGRAFTGNILAVRRTSDSRIGLEAFVRSRAAGDGTAAGTDAGGSAFVTLGLIDRVEVVVRYDLVSLDAEDGRIGRSLVTAAVAYQPESGIRLMPTILVDSEHDGSTMVAARLTAELRF